MKFNRTIKGGNLHFENRIIMLTRKECEEFEQWLRGKLQFAVMAFKSRKERR